MDKFDAVVYGSALAGSVAALKLAKSGKKVALIDSTPGDSDLSQSEAWNGFTLEKKPCYFSSASTLNDLEDELDFEIETLKHESVPLFFKSGNFTPVQNETSDILELEHQAAVSFEPLGGFSKIIECVSENADIERISGLDVEKLERDLEKNHFTLELTGAMRLKADVLIWASHPSKLMELIGDDPDFRAAKLTCPSNKTSNAYLKMDFALKAPVTDFVDPVFIPLLQKDKSAGYLQGIFFSNRNPALAPRGKQLCSWWAMLNADEQESNQLIRAKMRHMKRLIDKAFPRFMDRVIWSRLNIVEQSPLEFDRMNEKELIASTETPIRGLLLAGPFVRAEKSHILEGGPGSDGARLLLNDLSVYSSIEAASKALKL